MMRLVRATTDRVRCWLTGSEDGQGMLEYALILGLIVLAIIAAFAVFDLAGVVSDIFSDAESAISG